MPTFSNLPVVFIIITILASGSVQAQHQKDKSTQDIPEMVATTDTVSLSAGYLFLSPWKVFAVPSDTKIVISGYRHLTWDELQTIRSGLFYDSVYRKMNQRQITKLLYDLAFVTPTDPSLPDTAKPVKNDVPFRRYANHIIGRISIQVLSPFGTSISDSTIHFDNKAAKFGNNLHMNTRKSVLRNQLLIKSGETLDPEEIADNLRMIKDLSFIDDARFIVTESSPGSDTVDITLVAKDNWSIGGTLTIVDLARYRGSIYDANFLGSGDRFTVNMSIDANRAPFFQFDGISYNFTNINASFVDVSIALNQDNIGNQDITISASRPFFSYTTRFGGGIACQLATVVSELTDGSTLSGSYHLESAWVGSSSPLRNPTTRFVISGGFFNRQYFTRPTVTIDSLAGFYNVTQFLAGLSVYKSQYYNTDYIFRFGQIESVPYGFLYQLTMGPVITDFYTRYYVDIGISAGNFLEKFGYLYGQMHLGGYLNRDQFEDGLLKIKGQYMSYLYKGASKRYKFRSFVSTQLILGFNPRTNNLNAYALRDGITIKTVKTDSLYTGSKIFSIMASTVSYTPWCFYGFHFSLQASVEAGLVSPQGESLFKSPLFTGFGLSFSIENSNLIFPTLRFSCFLYPTSPGIPTVQFNVSQINALNYRGFNPGAPYIQTMQN